MHDWLKTLVAEANQSPALARVPFYVQNMKIGSVETIFMRHLALQPNQIPHKQLLKEEQSGWHLMLGESDVTSALNQLAGVLQDAGLAGARRNELLAVRDEAGVQIGTIERGAVRSFGIATLAVHLVGQTQDGRFWVQQRALNKPNDPGKRDTLMGGMVSAGDTVETALARETWEEAGLHLGAWAAEGTSAAN